MLVFLSLGLGEGGRAEGAGATGFCLLLKGAGTGDVSAGRVTVGVEERLFAVEDSDGRLCLAAELLPAGFLELVLIALLLLPPVVAGAAVSPRGRIGDMLLRTPAAGGAATGAGAGADAIAGTAGLCGDIVLRLFLELSAGGVALLLNG